MSYTKWDQADEFKLKAAVDKYGNNWNMIHKHVFPERGAICLKNKYYSRIHQNKAFEVAPDNISSGQNKSEQLNQNDLDLLTQVRAFMLSQERQ
ncbi:Myb-like_DNA-binding domain-containing protein [Hexamita inflata]|uniref:Myb-like DNA-binding domain-containing protein n=1 Tax=Hexamita inflata TaxID=28002 RepID=A0AA86PTN7_9EUKA|nr:Myb-like DNA-binding domain-containing protein [Hexamita inflata]CAI9921982.1 Myb-like DNA-binding domain-containing protein [Hexamita inflata]CAI9944631.1 Myb-like DNA-binding domain-containing protein [Hexamita inflata]CAI9955096.1 Myb-like DNA-binding domain-containing protein [Hexamita inflata]